MRSKKAIIELINQYLGVSEVEKKINGEVFTPFKLIREMLDTLPKEVWSNPDLKILDPVNGVGNFPAVVIERLMGGLKNWEPDEEKRYKHILENMIYVCDISPKNMFLYLNIFDPNNEYKMNYHRGSFLDDDFSDVMKKWEVEKFDIIVGNPPYQELKPGFKKSQAIWNLFVIKSINLLNVDGYQVQIHPSGWRNVDGVFKNVQNLLKKNLIYLEIHNEKDGLKTFGADTRYDFYCYKHSEENNHTKIKTQDGDIEFVYLQELEFIPNGKFDEITKLLAKNGEENVETLHSYSAYETRKKHMSKQKSEINKYNCVYTVRKGDELTFHYSDTNKNGHFNIPKLIWSNGRVISVGSYIDDKGEFGLTQFSYGIIDKPENLQEIKKVFDSKEFRSLMEICAVSDMSINHKIIALFRKDFWKEFIN